MEEKDFYEKIEHSINQAKEGKVICQNENESIEEFIKRMLYTEPVNQDSNEVQI